MFVCFVNSVKKLDLFRATCSIIPYSNDMNIPKDPYKSSILNTPLWYAPAGNTKGGSITVPLTSCLTGLESAV